jgi:hypothetical protein
MLIKFGTDRATAGLFAFDLDAPESQCTQNNPGDAHSWPPHVSVDAFRFSHRIAGLLSALQRRLDSINGFVFEITKLPVLWPFSELHKGVQT